MRNKLTLLSCFGSLIVAGVSISAQETPAPLLDVDSPPPALTTEEELDDLFSGTPAASTPAVKSSKLFSEIDLDEVFGVPKEKSTPVATTAPVDANDAGQDASSTDAKFEKEEVTGSATTAKTDRVVGPEVEQKQVEKPIAEKPLSPEMTRLRERVRDCLGYYYNQRENVADHGPWGVMHILIAYGVDTQVYSTSGRTNAIAYLCYNGNCRGQELFYLNRGRIAARIGPGVQGHEGQFLAMMAQSKVKLDYPMNVGGKDLTIADLVEYEKLTCEAGTELTFKLIGLSHYLDTDTKWKNQTGEDWGVPRLIKEELAQPIIGAACGGTHRLMGFNYAVKKREKEGKPLTGQYLRARKFLDDYFEYTFYLQNPDGSFSTDYFRGPNAYGDVNQRVETTGHILEWFVASLSDEQLQDERVVKGIDYLARLMLQNRTNEWEIGPKGHALHALAIYSERVFGDKPGVRDAVLARGRKVSATEQKQR